MCMSTRSLDVLGGNTADSQLHVDDRRRSSVSPRRTSGASSVSGIFIDLYINLTLLKSGFTEENIDKLSLKNSPFIFFFFSYIGYGSEISDSREAKSHGSCDSSSGGYTLNSKGYWRSGGYKKGKSFIKVNERSISFLCVCRSDKSYLDGHCLEKVKSGSRVR